MDFPGSARTNVHLIDGFSTIYWRIYTEEGGIANHSQDGQANGYTILKHLGRLKHLEARLRNQNCLASCPRRLGLWVFSPTPTFESLRALYVKEGNEETKKVVIDSTVLKVSASGSISSQELIKSLTPDSQNPNGARQPTTPKPQGQPQSRRPEGYGSSAAIYAAFISAVTGAISLHLVRSHGALPLGSRTLFTAVDKLSYESPRVDNESPLSIPCLTTLNVQLNMPGTLTITIQTIDQPGILPLANPREDMQDVLQAQSGMDLWLCPNGSVARLVTANIESPSVPSPGASTTGNITMKRRQWRLDVAEWLGSFGLKIDSVDDELWVEVEVWEPIFAKLAGDAWRQHEDSQSPLPLKRMLWPARFCFKRPGSSRQVSWLQNPADDPLEFAERWSSETGALQLSNPLQAPSALQEPQVKDHVASPRPDSFDGLESLSRMTQYPDLPPTNLVYPTPPEGTATTGLSNPNPDDTELILSPAVPPDSRNINSEVDPNTVGTGNYDASDDEDLFGEMNGRDFGSKGITDADFSFFDDPDLEDMELGTADQPQESEDRIDHEPDLNEFPNPSPDVIAPLDVPDINQHQEKEELRPPPSEDAKPQEPVDEPKDESHSPVSSLDREGQTISPPLSPVEIKKILFPGAEETKHQTPSADGRPQQGGYLPVAFERKISDWDQKYGSTGKFWFSSKNAHEKTDLTSNTIPTIGLPSRARGATVTQRKVADKAGHAEIKKFDEKSPSDSESESSESEDYIVPDSMSVPSVLPSLKRKRVPSESDVLSVASPAKSAGPVDSTSLMKVENETFLGNFLANFSDWSFIGYFSAFQAQQLPVLLRREDQIQVAQLLADQVAQSSLNHPLGGHIALFDLERDSFLWRTNLEDSSFLGDISKLELRTYVSLQEEMNALSGQQPTKELIKGTITRMPAPHLRVRRGAEYLETLPAAVSFWETFGLEPAHGTKDISAYCIYPSAVAKAADGFLNRFGLHYQSCNLGSHVRGDQSAGFENGMRAWESDTCSYASMMRTLKTICRELANDLSQSQTSSNCVVYIVNPFSQASGLADICAAFWHLFQELKADDDQISTPVHDIALQIIPMDFIASEDSMVVPTQADYMNLALEVYGRCRPKDPDADPLLGAPAVLLADSLPKAINFRLAPERASPLQDGRCLHVACSKSSDQRWLSVAWSDGTGGSTDELRSEIWGVTKHIMDKFPARWKVILANSEPIDSDEVDAWSALSEQQNKARPGSMDLTIVTASTIPDLALEAPAPSMTPNVLHPTLSSTPVSTPNPNVSIASPEQSATVTTPSAMYNAPTPTEPSVEPDADVILTDICDESWAVILSHRLNSSPHITELRPALASGYLLRRKGATDGDGVYAMTVNLVHTQRPASSHDAILRDVLSMYRDLASLARTRGIRSVQANTMPWHIATALRAQELLSYVF
ncbi:hypothetical protein N7470_004314 [Penicillium chermesinum]|nr:hypothetical protein N7470_004314 [Penicillium chermesinum]